MKQITNSEKVDLWVGSNLSNSRLQRRSFLQFAGIGVAGAALLAVGCKKDGSTSSLENSSLAEKNSAESTVDLGSGDVGILNYAYALEQLEAAFYIQAVKTPYNGMNAFEKMYLVDICRHEVAHREFFKTALGKAAIKGLEVDFSKIDFTSRDSVLGTAKAFEDLGVAAYNGAGSLIKSADYLTLAGKIVSVEARHAAAIRNLIQYGSFANSEVIDANGLDKAMMPMDVLAIAGTFVKTEINASNLPTS
ncbi:MAG: Tat (Twin-arginine translocation) pathway signal sequence containing protein [Daejeonella sp.]|nr:Tat (Twin-arginine translocation) pathway signal sequence containing protein [Daejeonella sp.]